MQNGQGKCIRYAMSHVTGKIEILGQMPDKTCFLNIIRQNMKKTRAVYSARNWHLDRRGCRGDIRLCRRLFPGPYRTLPQANVKPRDIP